VSTTPTQGTGAHPTDSSARVRDLLTCLSAARRNSQFYPPEHPAVEQSVGDLKAVIDAFHEEGVEVALTFFEGDLMFGDRVMTQESILFDQLIRDTNALGIDSLQIAPGVSREELTRAVRVLANDASDIAAGGGIERVIEAARLGNVRFGRVLPDTGGKAEVDSAERARKAYEGAVDLVRDIDQIIRSGRPVASGPVRATVGELVDSVLMGRTAMLELTALRDYDEYTFYHSANVAILSLALGSTITSDPRFLAALGTGALLHDVGKMTVDLDILNKPGTLTPDEWQCMRDHPVSGARIVARTQGLDRSATVIVLEHHMGFDGSGYPEGAPRRRQHLASRVVAVADAYDAMTSRRSYSAARAQDEAMALIVASAGNSLDPVLVRLFVTMLGVYPPRSVVRLGDGSIAVVVRPGEADPLRPVVKVIALQTGEIIEPHVLDLGGQDAPEIERCLDPAALNIEVDDYL
jgi:HD-GYP domain-containing protein (c-di-GMP phosphodiesterase class II)